MLSWPDPQRGEVWRVDFKPARGDEIRKLRPAVVMSVATAGKLALRVIVPLTGWHPAFVRVFWHTRIDPTPANGLSKPSSADAFQMRSLSLERFKDRIGLLTSDEVDAIARAIGVVTGSTSDTATQAKRRRN
jgi:mRNA interferase MazF